MANTAVKKVDSTRRGPLSAVPRFEQEFERLVGGGWPRFFDWPATRAMFDVDLPNVDVIDREDDVCVRAELPGYKKDEIDVSVNDSTLTIKASSETQSTEEGGDYFRREISRGSVSRTVALPGEVDGEKAKARLADGVLEVTVPKVAKSKRQSVKIEV